MKVGKFERAGSNLLASFFLPISFILSFFFFATLALRVRMIVTKTSLELQSRIESKYKEIYIYSRLSRFRTVTMNIAGRR